MKGIYKIVDNTGQQFVVRKDQVIGVILPGMLTPGAVKYSIMFGTHMSVAALVEVSRAEAQRIADDLASQEE